MKKILLLTVSIATLFSCNNGNRASADVSLTTNIDSVSYAIGVNQAKSILAQVPGINIDAYLKGYQNVADSITLAISEADCQVVLQDYSNNLQRERLAQQQAEAEAKYADVKQAGLDFLEENKSKSGVKVTPSGLQYIVIKEGAGKQPENAQASVTVHYTGSIPDGTQFETSTDKDPITFALNGVIPGWTEGVQLMKEGAKYKFFIPQELAYGANPRPGSVIQPFMPLIFEIELIKVN